MLIKAAMSMLAPQGVRGRLSVLIFHRVLPKADPLFPDEPDEARFEEMMTWVRRWFNVLPLDEALQRLRAGRLPARAAAITFDDGYADNLLNAAPILKRLGLPATFFIATGFLDGGRMWNDTVIEAVRTARVANIDCSRLGLGDMVLSDDVHKRAVLSRLIPAIKHLPFERRAEEVERIAEACDGTLPDDLMLTTAQLRELRGLGMGIGAHTVSHPILASLKPEEARREIAESRDRLQSILGERIALFAYPNGKLGGDYTLEHVAMVESMGFDAAVATNWGVSDRNGDIFQVPRFTPWDAGRLKFGLRLVRNLTSLDRNSH